MTHDSERKRGGNTGVESPRRKRKREVFLKIKGVPRDCSTGGRVSSKYKKSSAELEKGASHFIGTIKIIQGKKENQENGT